MSNTLLPCMVSLGCDALFGEVIQQKVIVRPRSIVCNECVMFVLCLSKFLHKVFDAWWSGVPTTCCSQNQLHRQNWPHVYRSLLMFESRKTHIWFEVQMVFVVECSIYVSCQILIFSHNDRNSDQVWNFYDAGSVQSFLYAFLNKTRIGRDPSSQSSVKTFRPLRSSTPLEALCRPLNPGEQIQLSVSHPYGSSEKLHSSQHLICESVQPKSSGSSSAPGCPLREAWRWLRFSLLPWGRVSATNVSSKTRKHKTSRIII